MSEPYIFIFDLDNTLVNTNLIKSNNINQVIYDINYNPYSIIKKDKKLQFLLKKISNKKIIFSNASKPHIINVTESLGITNYFDLIIDRDITGTFKPNLNSYIITMQIAGIHNLYKCIL